VTYRLTPRGHELMAALQPLVRWGVRWHSQDEQAEAEQDVG
jgi:DNA-binding HxlR family transcriptional regulator